MSEIFKVFVVDDDPYILEIIRGILEPDCTVETFASVEACAPRLEAVKPDLFLLDVRMPGIDGYVFCRQIKDDPGLRRIPVIFVSSQDTIDARLKGYDAGGEDFITKPFDVTEIQRKLQIARQIVQSERSLASQLEDSELLSSLVVANMDEYAILMSFMREVISWESEKDIAAGILDMLQRYKLDGVVQTRISQRTLTLSARGANLPLETSVMNHMMGMERIFEFRNRSVYNFERLTLMINNMPIHDPDKCGRIRDNVAIAVECANARLESYQTSTAYTKAKTRAAHLLDALQSAIMDFERDYLQARYRGTVKIQSLLDELAKAFASLGLSEEQETRIDSIVRTETAELASIYDFSEKTQIALHDVAKQLVHILNVTEDTAGNVDDAQSSMPAIELF
jgi:CheY-like chemotaxis protein